MEKRKAPKSGGNIFIFTSFMNILLQSVATLRLITNYKRKWLAIKTNTRVIPSGPFGDFFRRTILVCHYLSLSHDIRSFI